MPMALLWYNSKTKFLTFWKFLNYRFVKKELSKKIKGYQPYQSGICAFCPANKSHRKKDLRQKAYCAFFPIAIDIKFLF